MIRDTIVTESPEVRNSKKEKERSWNWNISVLD